MSVIMLIFSIFCMYMIFMFSYQSSEISASESGFLYRFFMNLVGNRIFISHNTFRKIAHFLEFTALGFGTFGALFFYNGFYCVWTSFIFCQLYSISDEIHQYFVPGRACRVFDYLVDCSGVICGILVFYLISEIILKIKNKKLK